MKSDVRRVRAVLFAVLAALLYAVSTPVSKELLRHVPPMMLAGLLYLGAGIGLVLLKAVISGGEGEDARLTQGDMKFVVAMTVLDVAAPILLLLGLGRTTAANVSLLNNFEIVMTSVIAFALFGERISRRLWFGIATVTLACLMLSVEDVSSFSFSVGSLYVLAACACWGVENNCTRRLSARNPMTITIIKGFCSGVGSLCIAFAVGERMNAVLPLLGALALGFVAYGLSIWFYIRAQRHIGAARTSAYYALSPFMGVALSLVVFGELPTRMFWVALEIMIAGMVIVTQDSMKV